jgi:hypothetical protein
MQHLKSGPWALLASISLIVASTGAVAWQDDGSSYYWDRNGAGNQDELQNLYENNRDEYNRRRDQYPDGPLPSVPPSYRHVSPTVRPVHVEPVRTGREVHDVSARFQHDLL